MDLQQYYNNQKKKQHIYERNKTISSFIPMVYSIAYKIKQSFFNINYININDLVNDAFLTITKNWDKINSYSKVKLSSAVYKVAKNSIYNSVRNNLFKSNIYSLDQTVFEPKATIITPDQETIHKDNIKIVDKLINSIDNKKHQQIVKLIFRENSSNKIISEKLNLKNSYVMNIKSRYIKIFKDLLKGANNG